MKPWSKLALPRAEVREGRSFNPNEFAIALEQVVAGRGPEDYQDPQKFFARTYFTRALSEHAGMVLRRLAGQRANRAPDLTLITQFGSLSTRTRQRVQEFSVGTDLPEISANAVGSPPWLDPV